MGPRCLFILSAAIVISSFSGLVQASSILPTGTTYDESKRMQLPSERSFDGLWNRINSHLSAGGSPSEFIQEIKDFDQRYPGTRSVKLNLVAVKKWAEAGLIDRATSDALNIEASNAVEGMDEYLALIQQVEPNQELPAHIESSLETIARKYSGDYVGWLASDTLIDLYRVQGRQQKALDAAKNYLRTYPVGSTAFSGCVSKEHQVVFKTAKLVHEVEGIESATEYNIAIADYFKNSPQYAARALDSAGALQVGQGLHDDAIKTYERLYLNYPNARMGKYAVLKKAAILFDTNRRDEALQFLRKIQNESADEELIAIVKNQIKHFEDVITRERTDKFVEITGQTYEQAISAFEGDDLAYVNTEPTDVPLDDKSEQHISSISGPVRSTTLDTSTGPVSHRGAIPTSYILLITAGTVFVILFFTAIYLRRYRCSQAKMVG